MPEDTKRRVRRLQTWVFILTLALLAGAIAAPIVATSIAERNADRIQLQATREHAHSQVELTCQIIEAQNNQLKAQRAFARQIGVPWLYPIPEVPPECDGM